jgi:predicted ribosomally synthesized peptide with SipW-like signal peptide
MYLRKLAGLAAGFALAVGLIGAGVSASFTDSVTAKENINVGTFQCKIVNPSMGNVSTDGKSLVYTAPTIMSSAPGSAPMTFTVQNTGSIADVLTVATSPVSGPWSIINAPFAPVSLAAGGTHLYSTGVSWTELDNSNLGQSGTFTWTVSCNENGPTAIFDNHPSTLPGNLPSFGFESNSISEWGAGVTFAGTARKLSTATVTMSSWACETGSGVTCVTTPGDTFDVPITFNVYNVGASNAVGSVIATVTQTFAIPYRPSANPACATKTQWSDGTNCFNGKAMNITFTFSGQTLPATAIFGVAFNTTDHGYTPTGVAGAPYDSLNVATYPGTGTGTVAVAPAVGSFLPDGLSGYLADTYAGFYMDNGAAGLGVFRLDMAPTTNTQANGPYGGYEPAVQIVATY